MTAPFNDSGRRAELSITINDLRLPTRIGWSEAERSFPQMLCVTCKFQLQSLQSVVTDDLVDCLDYVLVRNQLEDFAANNSWRLVEKFVFDAASMLIDLNRHIKSIQVTAKKNVISDSAGITIECSLERV